MTGKNQPLISLAPNFMFSADTAAVAFQAKSGPAAFPGILKSGRRELNKSAFFLKKKTAVA